MHWHNVFEENTVFQEWYMYVEVVKHSILFDLLLFILWSYGSKHAEDTQPSFSFDSTWQKAQKQLQSQQQLAAACYKAAFSLTRSTLCLPVYPGMVWCCCCCAQLNLFKLIK